MESIKANKGRFVKKLTKFEARKLGLRWNVKYVVVEDEETLLEKTRQTFRYISNKSSKSDISEGNPDCHRGLGVYHHQETPQGLFKTEVACHSMNKGEDYPKLPSEAVTPKSTKVGNGCQGVRLPVDHQVVSSLLMLAGTPTTNHKQSNRRILASSPPDKDRELSISNEDDESFPATTHAQPCSLRVTSDATSFSSSPNSERSTLLNQLSPDECQQLLLFLLAKDVLNQAAGNIFTKLLDKPSLMQAAATRVGSLCFDGSPSFSDFSSQTEVQQPFLPAHLGVNTAAWSGEHQDPATLLRRLLVAEASFR